MVSRIISCGFLVMLLAGIGSVAGAAENPARVTIIYDAFGKPSDLERGWGYSALIEYGGGSGRLAIDLVRALEPGLVFRISDYGTRRRFARAALPCSITSGAR